MGLYAIDCPACNKPTQWFSGNVDQRCEACRIPRTWWLQSHQEDGFPPIYVEASAEQKFVDDLLVVEKSAYDYQCKELIKTAEAYTSSLKYFNDLIADKERQLLTEKAEVGRLIALLKRRSK